MFRPYTKPRLQIHRPICTQHCTQLYGHPLYIATAAPKRQPINFTNIFFITFRVSRRRREMYIGHARLCVCVCASVPRRIPTILHRSRCNLGNRRECPLVVHYWADLQSVHGFRCYDNTARTRNVSECLYSLYAWFSFFLETLSPTFVGRHFRNFRTMWLYPQQTGCCNDFLSVP